MAPNLIGVTLEGVSKRYEGHHALRPLSLDIEPGDALAVLGANGAGKSTLLWLLSTLTRPTAGQLIFRDGLTAAAARRFIGLLSHESLLYGDLTAQENIVLFGRLYDRHFGAAEAKALLERVGLKQASHRRARFFSRGMTQRLSLARALAGRPRLLLLDEPFSGLDQASTELVVSIVEALREDGAIVVLVTHDLSVCARAATRYLILRDGREVRRWDTPVDLEALKARYHQSLSPEGER